jgi:HTH-type transcriptional regulator / antitoxin HipB
MDKNKIAQMVLFHRKKSGLSRDFCAKLAGIGKTALYDIENGKTSVQLNTLLKVLHVLNIQMNFSSPFMTAFEAENSCNDEKI